MAAKRHRLMQLRKTVGFSQEHLAERVGVDRSTVGRWEAGLTEPQPWLRPRLARVLQVSVEQLDALLEVAENGEDSDGDEPGPIAVTEPAAADQRCWEASIWSLTDSPLTVDEMKRRSALKLSALPLIEAAVNRIEPWARLSHVLEGRGHLDAATLTHLEWYTADLFRREEHTSAAELAADLHAHLDRLVRLLPSAPDALRTRMLSTTGETLALAAWVAWDRHLPPLAQRLCARALTAADEARDDPLRACTLTYLSYMSEASGDLRAAQRLLEAARDNSTAPSSATTRSWVAARNAEVSASLAEPTHALHRLDEALNAYDSARPHLERPWTAFFTPSRLGSMAVTTYAHLDHPALEATATSVVRTLPATEVKTKAIILADIASAAIQQGQYDRGAAFARQSIAVTTAHQVGLGAQRLHQIHQMIDSRRHITVLAELDDLILDQVA